jgi:RluA family pseudouridine synthase
MTQPAGAFLKVSAPETREFWLIPVLWEDDRLLAVDKPSGLPTSPDRYDPELPNLMSLLRRDIARGAPWARQRRLAYLANTHRLDFDTSGVLLLAKDKTALIALANQFGADQPLMTCVALVHGSPGENQFEVNAALARHPTRIGLMHVHARRVGTARTLFEVVERFSGYTLLKCRPLTARTQQIRAHARSAGFPIVGDSLYGGQVLLLSRLKQTYRLRRNQEERPLMARAALHAEQLNVVHPVTGATVAMAAVWPKDFIVALKYLRRYAGES